MTNTRDSHSAINRIEVITSLERRRRWSRAEKEPEVAAMMEPDASVAEIAREPGVDPSPLYRWRQLLTASSDVTSFIPVTVAVPSAPEGWLNVPRRR